MDNLISLYQQRFNVQNATFSRIDHDDAMDAIVYKVTLATGEHRILKICSRARHYARERYFLNYFAGKLLVPEIIQTVPPKEGRKGAILMTYLPGALVNKTQLTNELAHEIGSLLARIHLNRVAGYGDIGDAQTLSADPRVPFVKKFEEGLAECAGHLPDTLLEQCRSYLDEHLDLLTSVDGPCIVHGDFRPGNILLHDNKVQGIIDWATAHASFAEEDFHGLENEEWLLGSGGKEAFLSGYATVRPVPDYRAIMPLLRLRKALGLIGFLIKRETWQTKYADLYESNLKLITRLAF